MPFAPHWGAKTRDALRPILILTFGLVLMLAVLLSERAHRTLLSTAVIFLAAGILIGDAGIGWVRLTTGDEVIERFAEGALFTILFVDGAEVSIKDVAQAWRLPGRALLLGMPLTIGGIALASRFILRVTWPEAFLIGAILSPTDPVFVTSILEHEAVPIRLRRLLGLESGLNDGIALPMVMILLGMVGHRAIHPLTEILRAGLGVLVGVGVTVPFLWLEGRSFFAPSTRYRPLAGIAIAAVLFGVARMLHANEFLAAFAGGVALATQQSELAKALRQVGRPLAESVKLATLLVFGAVLRVDLLLAWGWAGLAFALVALLAARPLALVLGLIGGGLSRKEWLAAAWFGPKGFASLLYALLMLHAGLPRGELLFQAIALVIVISIVAHSSTDVAVARVFRDPEPEGSG